jgi:site-specific DNA recombinase
MDKATLYLRSSKDRSDVSIDVQRRQLQELAAERNLIIVSEYADAVESGKDDDRAGFQQILRDIKLSNRSWNSILVLDTSRVARRRHLALMFERECEKAGIRVIYKSLPDSDPITEMLLKSILQAMDEWHSLTSKAKGVAGMAENIRQGWRAGGRAPKGYKLDYVATGAIRDGLPVTKSRLIKSEDSEPLSIYLKHRASGVPRSRAKEISGLSSPNTTLIDIERNALVYAGHTIWNRHNEQASGGGYVGGSKYRARSEWEIKHHTHEPLITDDEAEAILQMVGENNTRARKSNRVYILAGLIESPDGIKWWSDGAGSYRLGKGPRIKAEIIEGAVIAKVIESLSADEMALSILKHYKNIAKKSENLDLSKKLRSKVTELNSNISKLSGLLTQTTAPNALLRSIEAFENEREVIKSQLEAVEEDEQRAKVITSVTLKDIKVMLANIIEDVKYEKSQNLIKDVLATFIESIVFDAANSTVSLTYRIGDSRGVKLASPRGFEPRSPP